MKSFLFFSLCILLSYSGYSQAYHSFMHDTAIWSEWEDSPFCCDPTQGALSFKVNLIMMGDTSINSVSYKKIYYQQTASQSFGSCFPGPSPNFSLQLTGFVRDDSAQKVYYLSNQSFQLPDQCAEETFDTEKILYDFAINSGDTVSWKPYNNIVIEVDSIQAPNGEFLKRIKFDNE